MSKPVELIGYKFLRAVGPSGRNGYFIGSRFDGLFGFQHGESESWVMRSRAGKIEPLKHGQDWYTDLWLSPNGTLYVADFNKGLHVNSQPDRGGTWRTETFPFRVAHVWGLSNDFVLAWGPKSRAEYGISRWNGRQWEELPSPGPVNGIHGTAPNQLVAVGEKGLIAHWDGASWHPIEPVSAAPLTGVWLNSREELYAVGRVGAIVQGSLTGAALVRTAPSALLDVVQWKGDVWIAQPARGLYKLKDDQLEVVHPLIRPLHLNPTGETLIATTEEGIYDFVSDKTWTKVTKAEFADAIRHESPMWLPPGTPLQDDGGNVDHRFRDPNWPPPADEVGDLEYPDE